jgi:hypothetical protein
MWRTLAGGMALAMLAMEGPVANAATDRRPAAGHRERAPRNKAIAWAAQGRRLVQAEATGTTTQNRPEDRSEDQSKHPSIEGTQSSALDRDPTSDEDGEAADHRRGYETAKHAPQTLNRTEMLSLARKYAAEIAASLVDGERQRETAVRHKDTIKLACIQDRLSNMKLMKRAADQRLAATERPTVRQDELSLRHEFRGVEEAHKRVGELHRELKECVGESLEVTEPATAVPTTADPIGSNAEIPRMERPVPASVFN